MRSALLLAGLALASPSYAQNPGAPPPSTEEPAPPPPKKSGGDRMLAFGVSGDIGVFIAGLTIGTGGIGAYGTTGMGGAGGKAFFGTSSGIRVGAEGGVDWDFRGDIDSEWWWVGGLAGVMRPIGSNRFAGGGIGFGYGEGREPTNEFKQTYLYFRPRSSVTLLLGPLAAEFAIFAQLPINLSQTRAGRDVDLGWFPWGGIELTLYFVKGM